jgi:hypothetical protein
MLNPTLLAAVTVMLLLPNPKRLMLGYLLDAYTTSITLGLLIVFSLNCSSTESTSKHKVSPLEDIVVGLLLLVIARVLGTGCDQPFQGAATAQEGGEVGSQAGGRPADRGAAASAVGQR